MRCCPSLSRVLGLAVPVLSLSGLAPLAPFAPLCPWSPSAGLVAPQREIFDLGPESDEEACVRTGKVARANRLRWSPEELEAHDGTSVTDALDRGSGTPSALAAQRRDDGSARRLRRRDDDMPTGARRPQERKPFYQHISSTDVWDESSFWWTDRENVVGESIEDEWDPLKLINTDRPDFTDVATVVGNGVVQVETGFLQFRKDDGAIRQVTETAPNVLVRVGQGDHFEYRVKWRGYVRNEVTDLPSGAYGVEEGAADVELGFKWVMVEQDDWRPMQTWVVRCNVPVGTSEATGSQPEPGVSFVYNWQIRRWWFLRGATGIDLFNQPVFSFVRSAGVPVIPVQFAVEHDQWLEFSEAVSSYAQVSKRVGMFAEWFMFSRHGSDDDHVDHFHNYGLYLYATPNVQFDARIGWRVGDHIDESMYGAGFSFRL